MVLVPFGDELSRARGSRRESAHAGRGPTGRRGVRRGGLGGATLDAQESRPSCCGWAFSRSPTSRAGLPGSVRTPARRRGPVGGKRRCEVGKVFLESEPGSFLDDRVRRRAARSGCGEVAPPSHPFDKARFQHGPLCPGSAHDRVGRTAARPAPPCSWPGRMSGSCPSARRSSYASAVSQTGW
jgi:hypothetical protein